MQAGESGSQSLIHQVIYSVPDSGYCILEPAAAVSIPYSSGHLFRSRKRIWLLRSCGRSQSLIHQVIYSVRNILRRFVESIEDVSIPYSSGHLFRWRLRELITRLKLESQSLIHQVIYSVSEAPAGIPGTRLEPVSIPYSSGHLFRSGRRSSSSRISPRMSQSLIHQVIYSV